MATGRYDQMIRWVQMMLRTDKGGRFVDIDPGLIIYEMTDIVDEIARETHCRERTAQMILHENKTLYNVDAPIFKILALKEPEGWSNPIRIVTSETEWDDVRRLEFAIQVPRYARIWDGNLELYPAPGSDYEGSIVEVRCWLLPERAVDFGKDPDPGIGEQYDKAIRYGTLAAFLPDWEPRYQAELQKLLKWKFTSSGAPVKIDHWSNKLGF